MRVIRGQWRLRGRVGIVAGAVAALIAGGSTVATQALAYSGTPAAPAHGNCHHSPTITVEPFGSPVPDTPYSSTPEQTFRYTLTNCHGMQVRLLTYGAITQS